MISNDYLLIFVVHTIFAETFSNKNDSDRLGTFFFKKFFSKSKINFFFKHENGN